MSGPCFVVHYLGVISSFAIILLGKRELVALHLLPTVSILCVFLMYSGKYPCLSPWGLTGI